MLHFASLEIIMTTTIKSKNTQQESIPVGCVHPAFVVRGVQSQGRGYGPEPGGGAL